MFTDFVWMTVNLLLRVGGVKDLPPRFKRMMAPSGPEDLSLRPAANMVLKPHAPSMVPKNLPTANRPIAMTKNEAPPITKVGLGLHTVDCGGAL